MKKSLTSVLHSGLDFLRGGGVEALINSEEPLLVASQVREQQSSGTYQICILERAFWQKGEGVSKLAKQ